MMSLKANATAIERMLMGGPRLRSHPGTGGLTAVYQSLANAIDGEAIQGHWLGLTAGVVLMVIIMIAVLGRPAAPPAAELRPVTS